MVRRPNPNLQLHLQTTDSWYGRPMRRNGTAAQQGTPRRKPDKYPRCRRRFPKPDRRLRLRHHRRASPIRAPHHSRRSSPAAPQRRRFHLRPHYPRRSLPSHPPPHPSPKRSRDPRTSTPRTTQARRPRSAGTPEASRLRSRCCRRCLVCGPATSQPAARTPRGRLRTTLSSRRRGAQRQGGARRRPHRLQVPLHLRAKRPHQPPKPALSHRWTQFRLRVVVPNQPRRLRPRNRWCHRRCRHSLTELSRKRVHRGPKRRRPSRTFWRVNVREPRIWPTPPCPSRPTLRYGVNHRRASLRHGARRDPHLQNRSSTSMSTRTSRLAKKVVFGTRRFVRLHPSSRSRLAPPGYSSTSSFSERLQVQLQRASASVENRGSRSQSTGS